MALLDIRNLNIDIRTPAGDLHVVDNVDLTVNEGEIIALVGASGSGKSLMLQAITYLSFSAPTVLKFIMKICCRCRPAADAG